MKKIELIKDRDFNAVYLKVDGSLWCKGDPYLRISGRDRATCKALGIKSASYSVNGIYGFGGMGYRGPVSTRALIKGLNALGIDINARQLARMF